MNYYQQALRTIQETPIKSAYLFFGEEQYLADDLIQRIKQKFLGKTEPELNFFIRYASESGADDMLSLGAGMGLFTDRKIIILREADSLKHQDIERIGNFIRKKLPDICLILHTDISNLFQSRLKKLEESAFTVNLLPLRNEEVQRFIQDEFHKVNKQITPQAIELLLFRVGNQLSDLLLQVGHLVSYYSDRKIIDVPEVENIAGIYATKDVFEFNRQVGNQNLTKSLSIIGFLLESGTTPQMILSQLIRHFATLWKLQELLRSRTVRPESLAAELKIFPKYMAEFRDQSKLWKSSLIPDVFRCIAEADRELKNNTLEPQIILDKLCFKIINLK